MTQIYLAYVHSRHVPAGLGLPDAALNLEYDGVSC